MIPSAGVAFRPVASYARDPAARTSDDWRHPMNSLQQVRVAGKGRYGLCSLMLILPFRLAMGGEVSTEAPAEGWREGPVRYLLAPQEDKAYKKAKTEEERSRL